MLRYPTGCMQLDLDLGGGWPAGGMSTISGPDGAGKTALLYITMGMHQRIFGDRSALALAPVEFLPDYFFMRHCGMRIAVPDEMIDQAQEIRAERGIQLFSKDDIRELKAQTGEFYIIRGETGEDILDTVLSCYESNEFGIIGIDSINSFLPAVEAANDSIKESVQQGATATPLTRFCHHFHPMTMGLDKANLTALLCTGQVRANRERSNVNPALQKYIKVYAEILPWAIRHARLIGLLVWPGEKLKEGSKENRHQVGKVMCWETLKGKAGTHDGIRGETDFNYETMLDNYRTVVQAGISCGVLREKTGIFDIIRSEDSSVLISGIPGVDKLVENMATDLEFELALRQEILSAEKKLCTYR
jgi:RecA/RadA recombinase